MTIQNERELLALVYLDQKGSSSLDDIRAELKLKDDPDFDFDAVLNDLVKEKYIQQSQDGSWEITELGNIIFSDLREEKYEDLNSMPIIITAILIVIAILAFIKVFPRMFH
jgi:hypothetical protein